MLKRILIAATVVVGLSYTGGNQASAQVWCPDCQAFHGETYTARDGVLDALDMLNEQRRRAGLYALIRDPSLENRAVQRVRLTATWRGGRFAGHPTPINISPARGEGVGMTSGSNPRTVMACYTSTRSHRYAACKMYRYAGRTFFCLLVR